MALNREYAQSFDEALRQSRSILSTRRELITRGVIDSEAEQIVCASYRKATGQRLSRVELFSRAADRFPEDAAREVIVLSMARAEGKILQHLTGVQAFLEHEYRVGPEVLVPRPETEYLVTEAIAILHGLKKENRPPLLGFEIGLGSGAIAIELLSAFPFLKMTASELEPGARKIATENAQAILGAKFDSRLRILAATAALQVWEPFADDWKGKRAADFVISNPPYLSKQDPIDEEVALHEPKSALYGPESDVLHFYRGIVERVKEYVRPGGWVFLETPPERAFRIQELFRQVDPEVSLLPDLNQRDRVLMAQVRD